MATSTKLLPAETHIGSISLTVSNRQRALAFYCDVLGFQAQGSLTQTATLDAGRGLLIELVEDPAAPRRERDTGLFHVAIRVPSRLELARALRRLVQSSWPLQGFADHGVSQAIYLADPDNNGIEIYRDYPRQEWLYTNGQLQMSTDPLDVEGVLAELKRDPSPAEHLPPETDLGHIHLKVSDIPLAEQFYCNVLGFELIQRYGPSACFVAAGGYHHHIGMNTWSSRGASAPPEGAIGLRYFTIHIPEPAELEQALERIQAAGVPADEDVLGYRLRDPSGNGILLTGGRAARP